MLARCEFAPNSEKQTFVQQLLEFAYYNGYFADRWVGTYTS